MANGRAGMGRTRKTPMPLTGRRRSLRKADRREEERRRRLGSIREVRRRVFGVGNRVSEFHRVVVVEIGADDFPCGCPEMRCLNNEGESPCQRCIRQRAECIFADISSPPLGVSSATAAPRGKGLKSRKARKSEIEPSHSSVCSFVLIPSVFWILTTWGFLSLCWSQQVSTLPSPSLFRVLQTRHNYPQAQYLHLRIFLSLPFPNQGWTF